MGDCEVSAFAREMQDKVRKAYEKGKRAGRAEMKRKILSAIKRYALPIYMMDTIFDDNIKELASKIIKAVSFGKPKRKGG